MTLTETLGLIMLIGMVAVIFIGFPISFTLLFLALIFGGLGLGWEQTFNLAYLQIWGTMKDEIFPAVPLFIFMGYMTEQAGFMERLFGALRSLLAPVRGSLYIARILIATILVMPTGTVHAAAAVCHHFRVDACCVPEACAHGVMYPELVPNMTVCERKSANSDIATE